MEILDIQKYSANSLPMATESNQPPNPSLSAILKEAGDWKIAYAFASPLPTQKKSKKRAFKEHFRIGSTGYESFPTLEPAEFNGPNLEGIIMRYYKDIADNNAKREVEDAKAKAIRNRKAEDNAALDK